MPQLVLRAGLAFAQVRAQGSLRLARIVCDRNEHFGVKSPIQKYFERIAAQHFDGGSSIWRVIGGYDFVAVQKHLVAAYFVCASTVPVGDCQNTTAIRHGIDPKVICLSNTVHQRGA